MEKSMIKGERVLTALSVSNLRHSVFNLQQFFNMKCVPDHQILQVPEEEFSNAATCFQ